MQAAQFQHGLNFALIEETAVRLVERTAPPIAHIDLFVTEDCNLNCPYCFVTGKKPRSTDLRTGFAALDFGLARADKQLEVLLFGGEPFLQFGLMRSLVLYGLAEASRLGKHIRFSVTTNGTVLNSEMTRFCARHRIMILLSLDGGRESHDKHRRFKSGRGSFDSIVARIPLMKRDQRWIGSRVTPTPETIARLVADIRELKDLGINQFIIGPATGVEWTPVDMDLYQTQMFGLAEVYVAWKRQSLPVRISYFDGDEEGKISRSTWGCGAGRSRISVSVTGEIQACGKVQGLNSLEGTLPFGNVLSGFTISGLKNRLLFNDYTVRQRAHCLDCSLIDHCAGGCPATNFQHTGSIYLPNPQECEFARRGRLIKKHYEEALHNDVHGSSSGEALADTQRRFP